MCRLFALHAGHQDVAAEFWLLDAPDSFALQSETNADGFGIAALTSTDGMMLIRNPVQASSDRVYGGVARQAEACQYLAHLRYADTGEVALRNTHPFFQDGRVFAHNGVVGDLERLEQRLGGARAMVSGDTDSERFFTLITVAIREADGDVHAGITAAVRELADEYELYSLNFIMGSVGHLWAFRYPEHNPLHLLERSAGGHTGQEPLDERSAFGNMRVRSAPCSSTATVVISSERMDEEPGWREVASGELLHVGPDLVVEREIIIDRAPAHQMVLRGVAAKSQAFERDESSGGEGAGATLTSR